MLAQECLKVANRATERANEAIEQANLSIKQANKALYQANQAMKQANLAYAQAIEAYKNAEVWGQQGVARANGAYLYAQEVARSANQAYARALQAQADALKALQGIKNLNGGGDLSGLQKLKSSVEALQAQNLINIERAIQNSHRADIERLRTAQTIGSLENQVSSYRAILGQQNSVINSVQNNVTRVISGGGGAGIDSIKNDLSIFRNDLSTFSYNQQTFRNDLSIFRNDLSTFSYNQQTFRNDLSTFKNDLSTFSYNQQTFKNDLSTFKNDLSTFSYNQQTFKNDLSTFSYNQTVAQTQTNNRVTNLETTTTNLTNTQTQTNNRVTNLETTTTNLTNNQAQTNNRVTNLESTTTNLTNTQTQANNRVTNLESTTTNLTNTQTQTNNRVTNLESTTTNLTNTQTQTSNRVTNLENTATNLSNTQTQTNNRVTNLETTATNLQTQVNEVDVKVTDEVKKLGTTIDGLVPVIGGIAISTNLIKNQTSLPKLAEAAETGVCNASKPEGCLGAPLKQMKNGIDTSVYNTAGIGGLALQNAQILTNTYNIIELVKGVGSSVQTAYNYTKGKFDKLWDFLGLDRFLNIMNFAIGLHNAGMLSKNLYGTLIETTNNVLGAIGIKDPEGQTFDIGPIIGGAIDSWMAKLLGASVWAGTKDLWNRANRIVAAAARIKDATYAFGNSLAEIQENIGENVAQLSNAFIEEGIISEKTLDYKDPKPQYKQHFTKTQGFLTGLNESAEAINELVQQVTETTELATEMIKAFGEFKTTLENGGKAKTTEETTKNTNSTPTVEIPKDALKEGDYGS
ncbi:hypothetical protein [Gloeothece verrucosa]|uniref:Chromosome segregation ATPase-like protein n=1 Tax=Gloeothece verrucosa (strain PCC 7822) TaxID=497965 RepID=E0UJ78_GLOV7|nr:hypothetical protein [Gloeothece verrucosa]ADN15781.1 hypothetical protein Cyan7822_3849 [Gloeothece verrucosa PCC 7822]